MATITLKNCVQSSKFLSGLLKPVSKVYASAAGYQQIGNFNYKYKINKTKQNKTKI